MADPLIIRTPNPSETEVLNPEVLNGAGVLVLPPGVQWGAGVLVIPPGAQWDLVAFPDDSHRDRTTVDLPPEPCIVLWDGASPLLVTEDYNPGPGWEWPPISRAATVARLRALADVIEALEAPRG